MAVNDACFAIEDEHHEDVAIIGTDQDMIESAGRHAVGVFDSSGRAIVPLEIGGRDRPEVRPEIERRRLLGSDSLWRLAEGRLE
jgi:hypothetical protein